MKDEIQFLNKYKLNDCLIFDNTNGLVTIIMLLKPLQVLVKIYLAYVKFLFYCDLNHSSKVIIKRFVFHKTALCQEIFALLADILWTKLIFALTMFAKNSFNKLYINLYFTGLSIFHGKIKNKFTLRCCLSSLLVGYKSHEKFSLFVLL